MNDKIPGNDPAPDAAPPADRPSMDRPQNSPERPKEYGGRAGPEPTRYGDWENKGICSDF